MSQNEDGINSLNESQLDSVTSSVKSQSITQSININFS